MKKAAIIAVFCLASVISLWQLAKSRTLQLFGDSVARVETSKPMVALTFDDGPSEKYTAEVLKILAEHDVRATFFVTGHEAKRNGAQMRAIVGAGHDVGNHSYTHSRMVFMSRSQIRRELADTDAAIRAAGYDKPLTLFRPPYGVRLVMLPWVSSEQNRLTVKWDVAPDSNPKRPASSIIMKTLEAAKPGSIILLHPMYSSRETTRAAIGGIVDGLRAKGLEPVTLTELMEAGDDEG